MGKLQEFEIAFDKNKVVYSPGESISGTVTIKVEKALPCKGEIPTQTQLLFPPARWKIVATANKEVTDKSQCFTLKSVFQFELRAFLLTKASNLTSNDKVNYFCLTWLIK